MKKIFSIFLKPYPLELNLRLAIKRSLTFGFFVFAFLAFFKPFGLSTLNEETYRHAAFYGLITTVSMLLIYFTTLPFHRKLKSESNWNIGKEILLLLITVALVAIGNLLYSAEMDFINLDFAGFNRFLGFTISVAIFPVAISVLLRQRRLDSFYKSHSDSLNAEILNQTKLPEIRRDAIELRDDEGKVILTISPDSLIAFESADNYVKVYYESRGQVQREMYRGSLNRIENEIDSDSFFRSHRSYLINLKHVKNADGNARGYVLNFSGLDIDIPVARRRTEAFDKAMNRLPLTT